MFILNMTTSKLLTLVYLVTVFLFLCLCQDGKPKFRILAPQFICGPVKPEDGEKAALPVAAPGVTTIRLQTKAGQKMSFNWTVHPYVLNGPRGQRFNIIVWYAVRSLEKTLNAMSPEIAESNLVAINNTRLLEGVNYVFYLSGISDAGTVGDTNSFAIKFTDDKSAPKLDLGAGSVSNEQFSVLMLGPEVTYADLTYILEAHVTPCKPTNDYYFNWTVVDLNSTKHINVEDQLGKKLTILPMTLIGGNYYDISCKILGISDDRLITTSGIFINVLLKGMSVELNTESLTIAVSTPFTLTAVLKNPDNIQGTLLFDWSCKVLPDLRDCENYKSQNQSEINSEGGISDEGIYQFEVTIVKGNSKASRKAEVMVQNGMLPTIDIGYAPRVVPSNQALEIQAQVSDLRQGCNLQWLLLSEKGFAYFDTSTLPGVFGNKAINSREETFLSEIVEFGNETVVRNYPLVIPVASGSWQGLQPETSYKFRLQVDCQCTPSIQCEGPPQVTAYSDVIVETNGPPKPSPIKVTPAMGIALQTIFRFSTTAAFDLQKDYPLKYIFSYRIPPKDIVVIKTFIENLMAETILPFSEVPLIPVLKVCDARGACGVVEGSPVSVGLPTKISETDTNDLLDKFQSNLYRKDYADAFYLASVSLQTYLALFVGNMSFLHKIENHTRADIAKQMDALTQNNVMASNEFIKESTTFFQKFKVSEELLQDILKLRDSVFAIVSQSTNDITDTSSRMTSHSDDGSFHSRKLLWMEDKSNYKKISKRDVSSEDVENYMKVSEYIILNSKDVSRVQTEKKKIISNLEIAAPDLCTKSTKYPSIIDSRLVFLSVERINLRQNLGFIFVPYYPQVGKKINSTTVAGLQIIPNDKLTGNLYCITKVAFQIDLLSESEDEKQAGWVYYCSLFSVNDKSTFEMMNNDFPVMLKLPIANLNDASSDEVFQCRRWNEGEWAPDSCETNPKYEIIDKISYAICKCSQLGYISLYKISKPSLPTLVPPTEVTQLQTVFPPDSITVPATSSAVTDVQTYPDSTETAINKDPTKLPTDNFSNTTGQVEEVKTSDNGSSNKEAGVSKLVAFGVPCLVLVAILVVILLKRKWKKKTDVLNIRSGNTQVKKGKPKYLKFHAEHLMEGTQESLAKYSIMGDTWK